MGYGAGEKRGHAALKDTNERKPEIEIFVFLRVLRGKRLGLLFEDRPEKSL